MKSLELNSKINKQNSFEKNRNFEKNSIFEYENNEIVISKLNYVDFFETCIKQGIIDSSLTQKYSMVEIQEISKFSSKFKHNFESLYSSKLFYEKYSSKFFYNGNEYSESYSQRIITMGLFLSNGNIGFAKELIESFFNNELIPSTSLLQDSGKKFTEGLTSCFFLKVDDNLNSIINVIAQTIELSKLGRSVSIDFSNVRGINEKVKFNNSKSPGIIPAIKMIEQATTYMNKGNQRKSAAVVWLDVFHSEILNFINSKKINSDEKNRLQNISIGVKIADIFFRKAKDDKEICLFKTSVLSKKYKINVSEIDWNYWYEILEKDEDAVSEKISARKILNNISLVKFESGYPYIFFSDNANNNHPLMNLGKITHSNLCTEISQINDSSSKEKEISLNCNIMNINIIKSLSYDGSLETLTRKAINILDNTNNLSMIETMNYTKKFNKKFNSIILSALGFHSLLIENGIEYDSLDAKRIIDIYFMSLNFYSLKISNENATKDKPEWFSESEYNKDVYYQKYLDFDYSVIEKYKYIFKNNVPTLEMWIKLKNDIFDKGLNNAYRIALPPNQSSSYLSSLSPSIFPLNCYIEKRTLADINLNYLFNNEEVYNNEIDAFKIGNENILEIISIAQKHIDQSIANTGFFTSDDSSSDISRWILNSWKQGLKTIYYTRIKNKKIFE